MQYPPNMCMMNGGAQMVSQYNYSESASMGYQSVATPMMHQQVQYMEGMQQMPSQTVVQVQHVQPNPIMQTRNYTTSTTYQMPGASQTTAKFSSSRSGRIEAPKTFTVEEEFQEQIPIYQPPVVETQIVQQALPMQYIGQQQVQYVEQQQVQYVEQQQQQVQYMMAQPQVQYMMAQPQVQYVQQQVQCAQVVQPQTQIVQQQQYQLVEVEGPPQYVQVPGPKQIVEVPQPPLLVEVEGPSQVVQLPSPRQLVQVPVNHTTMVSTSAVPVVSYSASTVSSTSSTLHPVVSSVSSTPVTNVSHVSSSHSNNHNTSATSSSSSSVPLSVNADRVSYHVPPSSPGRSSMPYRTVTPDTTGATK